MLKINKNNNDEYIKKMPKKSIELMKSEFREEHPAPNLSYYIIKQVDKK
tara:strand:- start:226 stop:372 length:147 start_codon:yes stop_codon:yes gene_type:complete